MSKKHIKIIFPLEPDEDGFPPIGSESLHAEVSPRGGYVLRNTPFFVDGVGLGDRVDAHEDPDSGRLVFAGVLEHSSSKSISIIYLTSDHREEILRYLQRLGCTCEYGTFGDLEMLAVGIPEAVDHDALYDYLERHENAGNLSFSELAV